MTDQLSLFAQPAPVIIPAADLIPYTGTTIYETRGKAREYRELAANLYTGCNHGCQYCWAPLVLKRDRKQFHSGVTPRTDILKKLQKDAKGYQLAGERRQVLFCFTCDPYFDGDNSITRSAIQMLHAHDLSICALTKGGTRALRDMDLFTPADSFATTLTTLDEATSRQWEPNAAAPDNRMNTLYAFHKAGIPTWVSLEPVLDPDVTLDIIRRTAEYVDEFKVGVLNYHPQAKSINWKQFGERAVTLLESLGKSYYLKADLRKAMGIA